MSEVVVNGFVHFRNNKFDVEDKEGSGRPKANGSIIRRKFVPNARTYTYIRNDSISNFTAFIIVGNDLKARKR